MVHHLAATLLELVLHRAQNEVELRLMTLEQWVDGSRTQCQYDIQSRLRIGKGEY